MLIGRHGMLKVTKHKNSKLHGVTPSKNPAFFGGKRFVLEKRLGEGGMGVVYQVFDQKTQSKLALKTLKKISPQNLYLFKKEFRALADLNHPNLIRLYELISEEELWFFTMELLSGVKDFLSYVRPYQEKKQTTEADYLSSSGEKLSSGHPSSSVDSSSHSPSNSLSSPEENEVSKIKPSVTRGVYDFDEARLRQGLSQLALGIYALHQGGKIHRDIKPSNILIDETERLVLMDFGLVADVVDTKDEVAGTPRYMAPEQARGTQVGFKSDWYAFGVILYQVLTGESPFTGTSREILIKKQKTEPPPPHSKNPNISSDLDTLCQKLLRKNPSDRFCGEEILDLLGVLSESQTRRFLVTSKPEVSFVGRERELSFLQEAFCESRNGTPIALFIHGESGLGKSALVHHFLQNVSPDSIVLTGRCYEREDVPYQALDGVIDALSEYLRRLDPAEITEFLTKDIFSLTRIFPVLLRVPDLRFTLQSPSKKQDPKALRNRAFSCLQEILGILGKRAPLVVLIDDFQWADHDSLSLLSSLLSNKKPLPLLLLATTRNSIEQELPESFLESRAMLYHLALEKLSPQEGTELLQKLVSEDLSKDILTTLLKESEGNPFLLQELCRYQNEFGSLASDNRLDTVLFERVNCLPEEAKLLVELVCIAGVPTAQKVFAAASGYSLQKILDLVKSLRIQQFIRTAGLQKTDQIEPYHDRVRESVSTHLRAAQKQRHHLALAEAFERQETIDLHKLVHHFKEAKENIRAASYAKQAAKQAREALAFDQAADLYQMSLTLGKHSIKQKERLYYRLGKVLAQAGRGKEASDAFLASAKTASPVKKLDCQTRAAAHLLATGHIPRGKEVLSSLLTDFGIQWPNTPEEAFQSLLWHRKQIEALGLSYSLQPEESLDPKELLRINLCQAVSSGLGPIDTVRAADFQSRRLLFALRLGSRRHLSGALASEAIYLSMEGQSKQNLIETYLLEASRLASEAKDFVLSSMVDGCRGIVDCFLGNFSASVKRLRPMQTPALSRTGLSPADSNNILFFLSWSLTHLGEFSKASRLLDLCLQNAVLHDDRFLQVTLSRLLGYVWLLQNDPAQAKLAIAVQNWDMPKDEHHVQEWYELQTRGNIALYCEDMLTIKELIPVIQKFSQSMIPKLIQLPRSELYWLSGRLALKQAESAQAPEPFLQKASHFAALLAKEKHSYPTVWQKLLEAGILRQQEKKKQSIATLKQSLSLSEAHPMGFYAAVSKWRLGELLGKESGKQLLAEAESSMRQQNVSHPEKLVKVYAPGFPSK